MDPTVLAIGHLASRPASHLDYGVDISEATAAELVRDDFHLRSIARVQVKGKTKPVDVFTPIGARNENVDLQLLKWLESYEEGLEKFRARDFTQAKILFSRFLEFYPDDLLAQTYLVRALEYEQQPPDEAGMVRYLSRKSSPRILFAFSNKLCDADSEFVTKKEPQHLHFLGICGTAMVSGGGAASAASELPAR
jgi:hypothetical protein